MEPDPDQPRRAFDDERLEELAASIRAEGVLQPVVVRYDESRDTYVLVHGERRWRASKLAGQKSIPALVRDVPEHRRLLQQLMENVVRDDLNPVDRAAALRALRKQMDDAPWEQVAEAVGIKRSRLFQLLGTEKLPDNVRDDIQRGKLSEKQSRALQGLPPAQQEALRALMVEKDVSAPVATKIARALRSMVNGGEISHSAAQTQVDRLYALIEPADIEALVRQTQTLLTAVQQRNTVDLAKLLGVPRFEEQRVAKEVAALARSLTRADANQVAEGSLTRKSLEQLRAAIDSVLKQA
jgi:ParB/RepB/Spo0J family partition protein